MSALTDFLLARIAEDEADATSADSEAIGEGDHPDGYYKWVSPDTGAYGIGIKRARLVAECAAKRRIVASFLSYEDDLPDDSYGWDDGEWAHRYSYLRVCEIFAGTYADHPDCREEWKP